MLVMNFNNFNLLDRDQQSKLLWQDGVRIADMQNKKYQLSLYQLKSFYVEVWYHIKQNKIIRYRTFSDTDELLPYLNEMEISSNLLKI